MKARVLAAQKRKKTQRGERNGRRARIGNLISNEGSKAQGSAKEDHPPEG